MMRLLNRKAFIAVILLVVCQSGKASDEAVISYAIPDGRLTLGEPVLVELRIENHSPDPVIADLGENRTLRLTVSVARSDGEVLLRDAKIGVAPLSPYFVSLIKLGPAARVTIQGGGSYRQQLLLKNWYRFRESGVFRVDLDLTAPILTKEGSPIEVSGRKSFVWINLDPYDRD